ncbi:THAP domain-containing protein 2-like isoform X2 [Callorhinchus milii]|uniref:THAP domain-containing protein 2-like isoform X2 n=1 Tax=Callorhinchus milii TaxID=7868 RepID=UPI001C3FC49C|nr:THAP domain-containing protein 2-like isoform X2 [Callorhinchus milii]
MPTSCAAYGCTAVFKKNTNVSFHRHFESTCFDRTGQTRRLREDAVPTIFDFPPHLQDKKLPTRKSEQIPEGDCSQEGPSKAVTESSFSSKDVFLEHSYCLDNPIAAKRKIFQLQDEVEVLRKKIKISKQRERRVAKKWSWVNNLLENLKEKYPVPDIKVEEPM